MCGSCHLKKTLGNITDMLQCEVCEDYYTKYIMYTYTYNTL